MKFNNKMTFHARSAQLFYCFHYLQHLSNFYTHIIMFKPLSHDQQYLIFSRPYKKISHNKKIMQYLVIWRKLHWKVSSLLTLYNTKFSYLYTKYSHYYLFTQIFWSHRALLLWIIFNYQKFFLIFLFVEHLDVISIFFIYLCFLTTSSNTNDK